MNKTLKITLIVLAALILAGGALAGGWYLGGQRAQAVSVSLGAPAYGRPGFGAAIGPGMMGGRPGGMMGGYGRMMQGYGTAAVTPLTIDDAEQAAQKYLDSLALPDLEIAEVMIFDNGAYVRVVEKSTAIGAFELLVDPVTLAVYPEHGPNMMWNLKYSGLNHGNMMGGRGCGMGYSTQWNGTVPDVSAEMRVGPADALAKAQAYLDSALPGATVADEADAFYGYYTIDVLRDGKVYGMLSVNGFTGQVFYHSWHGVFVEMSEED